MYLPTGGHLWDGQGRNHAQMSLPGENIKGWSEEVTEEAKGLIKLPGVLDQASA